MIKTRSEKMDGIDWYAVITVREREREKYLFVVFDVVSFFVWNVSVIRNAIGWLVWLF